MNRNPDLRTPWSKSSLMHHPGDCKVVDGDMTWPDVSEWRSNEVFEATLRFCGTERGRSAAFFRWRVVGGGLPEDTLLPMFITDVGHIIMQGLDIKPGGVVAGRWFVVKRGQNYGITPAPPADDTPPRGHERPTENRGEPATA